MVIADITIIKEFYGSDALNGATRRPDKAPDKAAVYLSNENGLFCHFKVRRKKQNKGK